MASDSEENAASKSDAGAEQLSKSRGDAGSEPEPPEGGSAADYEVGYGKPPPGHRFQPGRSGNPKGRPRGDTTFRALFARELDEPIAVKEQGRRRKITKRHAIVKRAVAEALQGSLKHLTTVLAQEPSAAPIPDDVTHALSRPADEFVKQDLMRRLRAAVAGENAAAEPAPGTTGDELPSERWDDAP